MVQGHLVGMKIFSNVSFRIERILNKLLDLNYLNDFKKDLNKDINVSFFIEIFGNTVSCLN